MFVVCSTQIYASCTSKALRRGFLSYSIRYLSTQTQPHNDIAALIEQWNTGRGAPPTSNQYVMWECCEVGCTYGIGVLDTLKGGAVPPDQVFNMLQTARKYTNLPANVYNHALQLSTNTLEIYGMMQKDGIAPDTLACSMILKDLMQKGHTTQVLDFLFDADKHGVRLQTRTLCALTLFFSRNHEYPNVLTCYDKIPAGAKLGPAVYYAALSSCREKPEKLLGVLHRMHQEDIKPNASILQFIVWTLRSMPRKAAEIFEENSVDDLRVLEQMVGIYSSLGEPEKAVNVLEKIAKPHWKLCYSAIFGCTYKEHLSLALRVVAHMKVAGIRPSASIFNHVILLCEKARDPVKAVELISEMRQHNIRPSLLALNNLVQLLAIQDFWEQAIVVIDTMLEDNTPPTVQTANAVVKRLTDRGHSAAAQQLVDKLKKYGVEASFFLQKTVHIQLNI